MPGDELRGAFEVKAGERVSFGGLLGEATIIEVPGQGSSADFVSLGGRIPAPLHSFRN